MTQTTAFKEKFHLSRAVTALAPMQDVTDLTFWKLMMQYGGPDLYFTEYFRVHSDSRLEKGILESIIRNPTGRPVSAQLIGQDVPSLVRTAKELQNYPIASVDLNLGCPAPIVCRKDSGGGLLRQPDKINRILGELREAVQVNFTVKTRIGFESPDGFDQLLKIFAAHSLDLLTVHGRTVKEMYRSEVHYDFIREAVTTMPCPVLANGNVYSAIKAEEVLNLTGAAGLMIGRGAIRNPWIFQQIRDHLDGNPIKLPTGRDVLKYVHNLYEYVQPKDFRETSYIHKLKKYMNYIGIGIEPTGQFLHRIRRVQTKEAFFEVCRDYLDHNDPMKLEPFSLNLKPRDLLAGVQT
jgi:nifR3 family TIM-barrel protein